MGLRVIDNMFQRVDGTLFVHYPHITVSYEIHRGVDAEYIVFDSELDAALFAGEVEEAFNLEDGAVELHCFGGTLDEDAISIADLLKIEETSERGPYFS